LPNTQTDTRTTERATCVAIDCIYELSPSDLITPLQVSSRCCTSPTHFVDDPPRRRMTPTGRPSTTLGGQAGSFGRMTTDPRDEPLAPPAALPLCDTCSSTPSVRPGAHAHARGHHRHVTDCSRASTIHTVTAGFVSSRNAPERRSCSFLITGTPFRSFSAYSCKI